MKGYFFLLDKKNSTTTFSDLLFAKSLIKLGYNIDIVYNLDEKLSILNNCDADIIFFQKTIQCPAHTSKYISKLKNKVFLCHIDDDFQDMKSIEHINTLKISDLILVGTELHKKSLQSYVSTPIDTISCLLDDKNYPYTSPRENLTPVPIISWQQSCADAYVNDLLSISSSLIKLHEKYNYTLNLYGWHMGIDYPDLSKPVRETFPWANLIPYEPMEKYLINIVPKISKSDIFILPYINIPDRIGKSGFSLKRIMLLGIPVVASCTDHNKSIINDGIDGFLASSETEWYNKIEALILDKNLRFNFSKLANLKMNTDYNEDIIIDKFINNVKKYFNKFNNK